jgi:hypothetical protein
MTRPARVALICTLLLLAAAVPARAEWQPGPIASPGWQAPGGGSSALTSDGDGVVAWAEYKDGNWRTMLGTFPRDGGPPVADELGALVNGSGVAADGAGNAVAMYTTAFDHDIHWRERPAGGTFGAAQGLGLTAAEFVSSPTVVMNARGDLTFVWAQSGAVWAAIRAAGASSVGAPEQLAAGDGAYFQAGLSATGELLVAWQGNGVHAVHRSEGGETSAVQTIGPAGAQLDHLAMDTHGRAILTWQPSTGNATYGRPRMSVRAPGGDFTRSRFPGTGPIDFNHAVGIAGDGVVTLAYANRSDVRVYSGSFGGPLHRVRSVAARDGTGIVIATSPGGRTLLAWAEYPYTVTTQRVGDGGFGPVEDLSPACEQAPWPRLHVDDMGRTLAVWGGLYGSPEGMLALGDTGAGHQGCASPGNYEPGDYASPPPHGGPGGGTWGPPLPMPEPPEQMLGGLTTTPPKLLGAGARRTLSVRAECGESCFADGALGIVGPNGRVLARIPVKGGHSEVGELAFDEIIELKPALRHKLAGHRLKAELRLRFGDGWGRRFTRRFNLTGKFVSR